MRYLILIPAFVLAACSSDPSQLSAMDKQAHPFIGCWESDDGLGREVWTADPSGWLFGYALNRNATGEVTFFEQMRIETKEGFETLIVSGPNDAPVSFARDITDNGSEYRFINPEHDFPQVISYYPMQNRLDAEINLIDGSNPVPFEKKRCEVKSR